MIIWREIWNIYLLCLCLCLDIICLIVRPDLFLRTRFVWYFYNITLTFHNLQKSSWHLSPELTQILYLIWKNWLIKIIIKQLLQTELSILLFYNHISTAFLGILPTQCKNMRIMETTSILWWVKYFSIFRKKLYCKNTFVSIFYFSNIAIRRKII